MITASNSGNPLLQVKNLVVRYYTKVGPVTAVNGVSFAISRGEILALVGESGSGKSVTGRSILGLVSPPGKIVGGEIIFNDQDLTKLNENAMREIRGKEISLIPQDPIASLNPSYRISTQLGDVFRIRSGLKGSEMEKEAISILRRVGIADPEGVLRRYPHQLSGGMCQRILIAMAFALGPSLVIADEPTTSLDVITQDTIIRLMKEIKEMYNTSILFITHNLLLASTFAHRIAVMYAGKIMEVADSRELFNSPRHPYSQNLINVVPSITKKYSRFPTLPGSLPNSSVKYEGCPFYPRCPVRLQKCAKGDIPEIPLSENHSVSCLAVSG